MSTPSYRQTKGRMTRKSDPPTNYSIKKASKPIDTRLMITELEAAFNYIRKVEDVMDSEGFGDLKMELVEAESRVALVLQELRTEDDDEDEKRGGALDYGQM